MNDTIFDKIIRKEVPAEIVYEDDLCLAFNDVSPQAPIHILIIPKRSIAKVSDADTADQNILGHLLLKAGEIAEILGVKEAFRLVINNGEDAGQTVFHLHIHLLAGRSLNWPPG
ncbi:MAG: histidine triad nucleotide-binding protein [Gammaproteobacteria bacterium]